MSSTDEMPGKISADMAAPMATPMAGDPGEHERYVQAGLAAKVKQTLGKLSFVREAVAAYFCARDPATPFKVKAAILAALAYFIMPLDAVPDLIAILGYTDDAAVFWATYRFIAPHISGAHRDKAAAYLKTAPPDDEIMPD